MKISERDISDLRHEINNARKRPYYARVVEVDCELLEQLLDTWENPNKDALDDLESEIEDLQDENMNLEDVIEELKDENADLKEEVASINRTRGRVDGLLDRIQNELDNRERYENNTFESLYESLQKILNRR